MLLSSANGIRTLQLALVARRGFRGSFLVALRQQVEGGGRQCSQLCCPVHISDGYTLCPHTDVFLKESQMQISGMILAALTAQPAACTNQEAALQLPLLVHADIFEDRRLVITCLAQWCWEQRRLTACNRKTACTPPPNLSGAVQLQECDGGWLLCFLGHNGTFCIFHREQDRKRGSGSCLGKGSRESF